MNLKTAIGKTLNKLVDAVFSRFSKFLRLQEARSLAPNAVQAILNAYKTQRLNSDLFPADVHF